MLTTKNENNENVIVMCDCGCDSGLRIKVERFDEPFDDTFAYMTYLNANYYRDQTTCWHIFTDKLKKIWAIIRSKDHYYAEVAMNKEDFIVLRDYLNEIEVE